MPDQDRTGGDRASIEVTPDGPYIVRDLKNFRNSKEDPIQTRPTMALCRCGKSSNKPFCDATHRRVSFSGKKAEDRIPDRLDHYQGKEIAIHDNRGVCSRAGYCTENSPSVFRVEEKPWIDPDGADTEEIAGTIRLCPSGALSYSRNGTLFKDQNREPKMIVAKNGPYCVEGGPTLIDSLGSKPESREHYTLCRCGESKNKPFCDGTHIDIDFKDIKN